MGVEGSISATIATAATLRARNEAVTTERPGNLSLMANRSKSCADIFSAAAAIS